MQRLLLLRKGAVWTRKRTLAEVKLVREQQHVIRTFTNFNLRGLSNDHGQRPEGSQTQAVATQGHSGSRPANRTRWNSAAPPDVDSPVRLGLLDAQASHSLIDLDQDVENDSQLPRLPVPPLRQTLERYLQTLRPLVSEEDLAYSAAVVEEFGQPGGLGELLQEQLLQKVKRTENWLFDWWVHSAFLDCRLPLVVHSNPGVLFPKQDFHDIQGQLRFASRLIAGVLSFKSLLDRGQLPRSHYHGRPLCMDQYTRIFSSCRIPGPRRDSVINYGLSISEPRHITVAHNNQFFKLDVYHYNGCPLTQGQIYTQLEKIWNSSIKTIKEPVGILTADHRNRWGVGRRILMKDWLNRESIEEIQQSIFAICLDAPMPHGHDEYSSMAAQILHGGGSHSNTGNRWFDKTLQFIVGEDGTCGLLYERALAEGMPIMRISDHAMQFCKYPERAVSHGIPLPMPKKLHLNISSEVQYLIETSKIYLDIQVNDLDICCFEFSRFGKNFPKWYRLSPDGFIQMALQLAFYRLHGHVCASSETATTWMFHLGRTDEIRVTLEHTVRFVCSFDDVNTTDAEKLDLLKKAIAAHKENTNQAVIGQGIDRHLFGLKMQAIESGFRVPEIFMDTAYAISTHFRLATNQIPSQMNSVMCYGPVVPDGYNVCYNPLPYHVNFTVTALNSSPQTNAKHLSSTLISALNAMHDLLDQHCGVSPWETAQW